MIYIDPPYNTGNDFVYPDDYADNMENYLRITGQKDEDGVKISSNSETSGRYHTNWLNMMYPRLRLARNLLTDDGAIFISIDDNEMSNLKRLCDDVLGEDNFFAEIIVQSNKRGQTYKQVSKTHEYLLIYTKNSETQFNELEKEGEKDDLNLEDNIGRYNIRELRNRNPKFGRFNRPNLFYAIYVNENVVDKDGFFPVSLEANDNYNFKVIPLNSLGEESCWRWGQQLLRENNNLDTQNSNVVAKKKSDGNYNIYEKYRKSTYKPKSIWQEVELITEKGTIELGELDLSKYFDFPKPVSLIKKAIQIGANSDSLILDFFSGSATTAHAVMQLNAEDGGNRKFIMVQLPEPCTEDTEAYKSGYKNICEIGKERIRRAGDKIKAELREKQSKQLSLIDDEKIVDPENLDIGFKVFKLDSSNLKKWNPGYDNLDETLDEMLANYVDGRTELDVVYEIMLKYGIDLTLPVEERDFNGKKVYSIGLGALVICLDNEITTDIAGDILKLKKELAPETMHVVFKDNGFKDDAAKTNVIEMLKQGGVEEFVTV
jgi:adenine-specific DNA-methyltransferase